METDRMDERLIVRAREMFGDVRLAVPAAVRRPPSATWPGAGQGWTPAHSEAARFLGECFAVGAVLGLVVEAARPLRPQRHG